MNYRLIVGVLGLTIACHGAGHMDDVRDAEANSGLTVGTHEWTTPDGNTVPYDVAGNADADVTVVLVHCWMCDRSFWSAQLPALAERYRTVALDLPGHGEASSRRDPWTIAAYGADVAGLVDELGLTDVVLMGHSMGGPVSLRAAALLPGKVRGILAVDTLHNAEFKFEGEQVEAIMQSFATDFVGTCEQFIGQMFVEDDVDRIVSHVREVGCNAERAPVGTALMRAFVEIDGPAWFRDAGVPIRAINASAPNPTLVDVNRKYADFDVALMDDVGHYLHMTRPVEFNELMLEALAAMTR